MVIEFWYRPQIQFSTDINIFQPCINRYFTCLRNCIIRRFDNRKKERTCFLYHIYFFKNFISFALSLLKTVYVIFQKRKIKLFKYNKLPINKNIRFSTFSNISKNYFLKRCFQAKKRRRKEPLNKTNLHQICILYFFNNCHFICTIVVKNYTYNISNYNKLHGSNNQITINKNIPLSTITL